MKVMQRKHGRNGMLEVRFEKSEARRTDKGKSIQVRRGVQVLREK